MAVQKQDTQPENRQWIALKAVKKRRRTKRTEYIAYECPHCNLFHLTSKKGHKVFIRKNHG